MFKRLKEFLSNQKGIFFQNMEKLLYPQKTSKN